MLIPCLYGREDKVISVPRGEETEAGGLVLVQEMCSLSIMKTNSVSQAHSFQFIRNEWEKKAPSALELLDQLDIRLMVEKFSSQQLKKLYRSFDPAAVERKAQ